MKKLFTLLCFFVTMNLCAQEWETLGTQTWVNEWRTMSEPFLGPAQTDETGAFKIYVRSEAQALAAGNMPENDGHIARWDSQCFITFGEENALKIGDVLSISFSIKADAATTITTQSDTAPGTYLHWAAIGDVDASTSWEEFSREVTVTGEDNTLVAGTYSIAFNLSDGQENNIYIKDIVLKVKRAKEEKEISWANIIVNSDLSGGDMSCFYQKVYPQAEASQSTATDGAIVIDCPAKVDNPWDSEFYVMLPQILPAGTKFKVRFNCKASAPTTITPQCYNAPLQYIHWKCFDDVPFSTEWTTFETTAVVPEQCDGSDNGGGYKNDFRSIKFNLTKDQDITYYFDNIVVSVDEEIAVNPQPFPWEEMMIEGYQAKAFYDFSTNIPEVLPTSGDLCYLKEFGLYNSGGGNRSATVSIPVEENDILVLKYNTKSNGYININYGTPNEALTALSGYQVFDITTTADDITFTIGRRSWIGAALVMKKDPNAKVANYTVNYLDEEYQPLREAAIRSGIVGSPIVLSESDKQPLFNEGETQKYLYKSDNANELTVASDGSTQVNIIFRKAEKYAWTATALMGSQTGYTTSGETWEGDKAVVKYPRYQLLTGKLWEKAATNKEYNLYLDVTENNQEFILDYTETEIEDVVFLAEGEDIEGLTKCSAVNIPIRASQGLAGTSDSDNTTIVSSLPLGKYRIIAGLFTSQSDYSKLSFTFKSGERIIWNPTLEKVNLDEQSMDVVLPHNDNSIQMDETVNVQLDYICVQYLGVPTDEEIAEAIAGENSNFIYVLDAELPVEEAKGAKVELSIQMKNTAAIRGFQFDMYLPEGFSAVKDNKGRYSASLSSSRLPEDDEHFLTVQEQVDGAIRFLCGSLYDESFTGNDGEIITMKVRLSDDIAVGNYPIQLKNIKLTEININNYYETELMESVFRVTGESEPEELVVLPVGVEPEALALEGYYYNNGSSGNDVFRATEVAFDGTDIYVKGLAYWFEDSWLKGTLDAETGIVTFPSGQFVGEDDYGQEYMVGFDGSDFCDIQYKFNSLAKTLTQVTPYVCETSTKSGLDEEGNIAFWGYWMVSYFHAGDPLALEAVEVPTGLETETYLFSAHELVEGSEEAYSYQIQVGFDGKDVYFKGFSDYIDKMWAKGKLSEDGKTVTIPAMQYMGFTSSGIYVFDFYITALDEYGNFEDIVLSYDAEANTFSTSQSIMLNSSMFVYNPYQGFTDVTITKMAEFAATPADPSIDGYKFEDVKYPYINFAIPTIDVDGNDILTSKLFYTVWVEEDGEKKPFVVRADEYGYVEKDMTEIPYDYDDNYDILKGGGLFYINPVEAVANFTNIGIQSIYYGGGERHESGIQWLYTPEDYELYVAGVQVTSTNAKDILGDGGTFTYDAKTKTLTINGSYTYDDWFLIRNLGIDDLTIYVANDAELHAESPDFIFYFWKSTTITGPGKLTLYGNIAIINGAQLTIQDANIELPQTTSFAIMGNSSGEKLLVRNSNVHAKSYYLAIDKFNGGITIEDGMLDEDLRISDDGASICKTNGGDTNEVFIYDLEYVTGIKTLSDSPLKGESIYNLAGQRLSKPLKGINIQNGKKVLR